jgi:Uma2 family endonuclease
MNNLAPKRMTVPEFLAWAETQENPRYELIDGHPVAMAPERREHVEAKMRAANALEAAVGSAGVVCEAFVKGLTVEIDQSTGYVPDALVNCGEPVPRGSMTAPNPVIVVEVLSPSTHTIDTTVKLAGYFRVPSLAHYLIVDLDRQHVVHYRNQADGTVTVAVMTEGEIVFDPPGISAASFLGRSSSWGGLSEALPITADDGFRKCSTHPTQLRPL